jgi:lipopolysaccharide/colanic/teichoic acid biosynthesis glycosyltransferase
VLKRLRARVDGGYDVVGFIDTTLTRVGESIAGVEILGSLETIGKVIDERRVSEVIFSTDGLSYTDILSAIARTSSPAVNFRMVPDSLEAILGRTRIDELETLPLVDIEYNIQRTTNRAVKRGVDLLVSAALLLATHVPLRLLRLFGWRPAPGGVAEGLLRLPHVLSGRWSLVGLPAGGEGLGGRDHRSLYLGRPGLTGIVQLNAREGMTEEEVERLKIYYAKNQSLGLDLEILLKAFLRRGRRSQRMSHY